MVAISLFYSSPAEGMTCLDWKRRDCFLRPPEFRDVGRSPPGSAIGTSRRTWPASPSYSEDDAREFVARAVEKRALGEGFLLRRDAQRGRRLHGLLRAAIEGRPLRARLIGWASRSGAREATPPKRRRGWFRSPSTTSRPMMSGRAGTTTIRPRPRAGKSLGCRYDGAEPRHSLARGHEVTATGWR